MKHRSLKGHITPEILDAMFMGFSMAFNKSLRETESLIDKVAMITESTSSEEAYPWLGMTGKFSEWVGERVFQELKAHGFSIQNKTFEQSHKISRDVVSDEQYGTFTHLFKELGIDAKLFPDEVLFGLIRDAHNIPCYDGQNFYDNEHPVNTKHDLTGDNVPVSNIITQSQASDKVWYLNCTAKPSKPFIWQWREKPDLDSVVGNNEGAVWLRNEYEYGTYLRGNAGVGMWQLSVRVEGDITYENLRKARALMRSYQGDGAKRLDIRANQILCATEYEDEFEDLLYQEFINGTSNPAYRIGKKLELIASPYLDDDIKLITP